MNKLARIEVNNNYMYRAYMDTVVTECSMKLYNSKNYVIESIGWNEGP